MRELLCRRLHILLAPISPAAEVATAQITHELSVCLIWCTTNQALDNASCMYVLFRLVFRLKIVVGCMQK